MKEEYLSRRLVVACSGEVWGGTEHVMLRTCEGFARRGWQVLFVVRDRHLFESRRTDPDSSVQIRQLPFTNDLDLPSILRFAWMSRGADVVYVSMPRDATIGGIAGRLVRAPVVFRKGNSRQISHSIGSRLRHSRLPASMVVIGRNTKRKLRKLAWMRAMPIHVIYTGVDSPGRITAEQRAQVRGSLGIGESELLIVGPGRLASVKRWEWLIDATADLIARGHDVHTVLVGTGEVRMKLETRVAERLLGDRFRFAGYRTDVGDCIGAADICAHPSSSEGLGNVVLEALGRGVPTIATAVGGLPEIFESGRDALLCDVDDYRDFLGGLERLVEDPDLRKRLGDQGLRRVSEHHQWDGMLDELEGVFASVAGYGECNDG